MYFDDIGLHPLPPEPEPEPEPEPVPEPAEPSPLEAEGIAGFVTGDGASVGLSDSITLSTGGAASGQLSPASSDPQVTLYMTRDGSVPSADNNWGGPVAPGNPPMITRQQEGSGVYKVVAELDDAYSEVFTVFVTWTHEASLEVAAPVFEFAGRQITGSVEIPISDGTDEDLRLYISNEYTAAMLYITRDGSDPTPETFWKSQVADGTYLFSPEPTAAAYRVIAVWQDSVSPVASLDVSWVE